MLYSSFLPKREKFLDKMDKAAPRTQPEAPCAPHYPKPGEGRPPLRCRRYCRFAFCSNGNGNGMLLTRPESREGREAIMMAWPDLNILRERLAFSAILLAALALTVIIAAFGFEHIGGFKPCELCLMERKSWYAALPLALLAGWAGWNEKFPLARSLLLLLGVVFLWNAGLSFFHAGMEWKWWTGPASCSSGAGGGLAPLGGAGGLLGELENITVIPCDKAQFRLFGLSFAGYDALLSLFAAVIALAACFRRG
jgi:disulfide bond formation protein DsbB